VTLPEGWAEAVLRDTLASLRTGPFGSAVHKHDYVTGGTPLINPMHIVSGAICPTEGMAVDEAKAAELADFALAVDDVVLGRRGEMGRCAVVGERETGWLIGTGSMALTPSNVLSAKFLQCISRVSQSSQPWKATPWARQWSI
jgi:type I restriction enzyme S subunit